MPAAAAIDAAGRNVVLRHVTAGDGAESQQQRTRPSGAAVAPAPTDAKTAATATASFGGPKLPHSAEHVVGSNGGPESAKSSNDGCASTCARLRKGVTQDRIVDTVGVLIVVIVYLIVTAYIFGRRVAHVVLTDK
jgi:hypothetical protein